jgi:hypothetical protein
MPTKFEVQRNAGHSCDARAAFDITHICADTPDETGSLIDVAARKFWQL